VAPEAISSQLIQPIKLPEQLALQAKTAKQVALQAKSYCDSDIKGVIMV
jgi:hypothetical protein